MNLNGEPFDAKVTITWLYRPGLDVGHSQASDELVACEVTITDVIRGDVIVGHFLPVADAVLIQVNGPPDDVWPEAFITERRAEVRAALGLERNDS